MNREKRKIVVTSALPYANGDIHIGHLVEYLQTDFWVRFQKLRGNDCVYVCADDTHGTPVMIRARKEGITPEELIARMHAIHLKDFTDFQIAFDNYYTTNSPENKEFSEQIFAAMEKSGGITARTSPQLYCEKCGMFLPDRFVKGTCPKCGAEGQYGDSCDKCGSTYGAEELGSPKCTTCGGTPVVKDSEHLYFELEPQHEYLEKWIPGHTTSDVSNKLLEWFKEPLRGWCISRDAPYFGFEIPGHKGKFFYVWVDAPIGYLASLKNWCGRNGQKFEDWWGTTDGASGSPESRSNVEHYHFIGKDIIRFHCLFWPGMLHVAGFEQPDKIFVHGFLTVNGEKMSKSKGTFVNARTYLDHLPASALRYYYACKLGGTLATLAGHDEELALLKRLRDGGETVARHYEERRFSQAVVEICRLADAANEYFDRKEPWKAVKSDPESARVTLTAALNAFRILAIYLKPILPVYADKAMKLFGESEWTWDSAQTSVEGVAIGEYEYLASRIEKAQVDAMVAAAAEKPAETGEVAHESRASKNKEKGTKDVSPLKPEIAFPDFEKLDLRIGVVESCETVPKSSKLLKFVLDAGALGKRTIFSGIRAAYPEPEKLVGKEVVFVANLAPRKMSVGVSEGMILFAGEPGKGGGALSPSSPAGPGTEVT